MDPENRQQSQKGQSLKSLREARQRTIAAASARMKAQKQELRAIKAALQQGEKTVPEIAAATGIAAATVLWYLATLKKYGEIGEGGKDGSYFRYRLMENAPEH